MTLFHEDVAEQSVGTADPSTQVDLETVQMVDLRTVDDGVVAETMARALVPPPLPDALAQPAPPLGVVTAAVQDDLARAALELSELVEHHRRELADTMAELTRLQRELRAETRAAIDVLRDHAASTAGPLSEPATEEPAPTSSSAPTASPARRRLKFLRL